MKKSLFSGVSLMVLALAGGANAADLGPQPVYKAPALAPAPWSWTGFYVGANVGIARARNSVSDGDLNTPFDANKTGVIGGLQAGYNWQFNSLVLGLEADISLASLNRNVSTAPSGIVGDTYSSQLDALGTMRGRIGYAFDRALIYGTGGVAFASLKEAYNSPGLGFTTGPSSTVAGWTAGGGIEYAVSGYWTVKAEYLHVGFPSRSSTALSGATPYTFGFKDSLDIGRVGINYKF